MVYLILGISALICFFSPRLLTLVIATGAVVALAVIGSTESWIASGVRALLIVGATNLAAVLIGRLIWQKLIGESTPSEPDRGP